MLHSVRHVLVSEKSSQAWAILAQVVEQAEPPEEDESEQAPTESKANAENDVARKRRELIGKT